MRSASGPRTCRRWSTEPLAYSATRSDAKPYDFSSQFCRQWWCNLQVASSKQ